MKYLKIKSLKFDPISLSFIIIINLLIILFFYSYSHNRELYKQLVFENRLGEYLQFIIYFLSSVIAVIKGKMHKDKSSKYVRYFLALFLMFLALEEISWGQWILGFRIPWIQKMNLQREVNLHNMFNLQGNTTVYICWGFLFAFFIPLIEYWAKIKFRYSPLFLKAESIIIYIELIFFYSILQFPKYIYFYEYSELIIALIFLWVLLYPYPLSTSSGRNYDKA